MTCRHIRECESRDIVCLKSRYPRNKVAAKLSEAFPYRILLFGNYRINVIKSAASRMGLEFDRGEMNFYSCSLKHVEGDLNDAYDWIGDVMSDQWDATVVRRKLFAHPNMLVCDALLSQDIFAGMGNIIKNEVLFRVSGCHQAAQLLLRQRSGALRATRPEPSHELRSLAFMRYGLANRRAAGTIPRRHQCSSLHGLDRFCQWSTRLKGGS